MFFFIYLAFPPNFASFSFHLGKRTKQKPKLTHLSQDIYFYFFSLLLQKQFKKYLNNIQTKILFFFDKNVFEHISEEEYIQTFLLAAKTDWQYFFKYV